MPQVNQDLVSTRIKKTSKQKLELIKAAHAAQHPALAKSDYAMLERLIDYAYEHALDDLGKLSMLRTVMQVDEYRLTEPRRDDVEVQVTFQPVVFDVDGTTLRHTPPSQKK